ncbi:hypothetical protein GA0070216_12515 [Micromonospora matsumotoense]|uniref:Uncharacterized protein n=1 Tax=Micromonospora matsumotoense TaxID=121616 RepID=A0A1C5AS70_9ACTN|nr:hypothetical protein GA0070216_12515 [Micromonospora matsumotoense]
MTPHPPRAPRAPRPPLGPVIKRFRSPDGGWGDANLLITDESVEREVGAW